MADGATRTILFDVGVVVWLGPAEPVAAARLGRLLAGRVVVSSLVDCPGPLKDMMAKATRLVSAVKDEGRGKLTGREWQRDNMLTGDRLVVRYCEAQP